MARPPTTALGADGVPRAGLRLVYVAESVLGLADGVVWIAMVALLAPSEAFEVLLTVAVVVRLLPRAALSYPVGLVVDRLPLRAALLGTLAARGGLLLVVAAVVAAGGGVAVVLGALFVGHVVGVPHRPLLSAALPEIAGEHRLATAAATLSTVRQLTAFVGPLLGVVVVRWSVVAGFVVEGLGCLVAVGLFAVVRGMRRPDRVRATVLPISREDRAGRARHGEQPSGPVPGLVGFVALVGGVYVVRGVELVVFVLVVTELLGAPAESVGYLTGGVGLGALVAAVVVTRVAERLRPEVAVAVAAALTAVPFVLLTLADTVAVAVVTVVAVGLGMVLFELVAVATVQRATPRARLGAVFGALGMASNGGRLLGALVAPGLVAVVGVAGALVATAVGLVVATVVALPATRAVAAVAAGRRADLRPTATALARIPLFAAAPGTALERLAAAVETVTVPRRADVVEQGAPADAVYIVRDGDVDVVRDGRRIDVIGAGGWFGEVGIVRGAPRNATVRSQGTTELWRLPADAFLEVINGTDAPPTALVEGLAVRVH